VAGHTPGPWMIPSGLSPDQIVGTCPVGVRIAVADDPRDARLIAAAPAMLAALKACVGSEGTGAQEWALKLARASIAQATGKGI